MGVSAMILVALGVPLAIAVRQSILNSEVVELQARAARTLTEIESPLDPRQISAAQAEPDANSLFSVYDGSGRLVFGSGPARPDDATRRALAGGTVSLTGRRIVIATPITDNATERITGALRLAESLDEVNRKSRLAWLTMLLSGGGALALGWFVARRLAGSLSRPVSDLATAASRLGDGGALTGMPSSGIPEIDTLAGALSESSRRVSDALARERRFSADVSHQLRTPLTGLRLALEAARTGETPLAIEPALDDLTRIEQTVEHLLAFARDAMPATASVRLDQPVRRAVERWTERVAARGRSIAFSISEPVTAQASTTSVDQILDVLIDNALHHGQGTIKLAQRRLPGGGAIDVSDQGNGLKPADAERIFRRGEGRGTGIGLALARSIAEAEGGRLVLAHHHPTAFSLILLAAEESD